MIDVKAVVAGTAVTGAVSIFGALMLLVGIPVLLMTILGIVNIILLMFGIRI